MKSTKLSHSASRRYLYPYMGEIISKLKVLGKTRTSETYQATLSSFKRFRSGKDILLADLDDETLSLYEAYMRDRGLTKNTTSFYIRILRAVYNRALKDNLIVDRKPFRYVYTGVDKTRKRAIDIAALRRLAGMDLRDRKGDEVARDLFLFSFYTRGMSFVDMACLQKRDLKYGVLSYRRRKTGQMMYIHWEMCMQRIADKYDDPSSPYLLPIITNPGRDFRPQYIYRSHKVNERLKALGREHHLPVPLTMYVARHSWASIARNQNVPLSVISEGMGHTSEKTTRIYLDSIDAAAIDNANRMIVQLI